MKTPDIWTGWREFSHELSSRCWRNPTSEGLIVPYFRTEFNRCVEHSALNDAVAGRAFTERPTGWYQVATACRANDMRKVDSGWHATLFEMLVWVSIENPTRRSFAVEQLTRDTVHFLTEILRLDPQRISVALFGGGEVLPKIKLPPDTMWREQWIENGICSDQIHEIPGPKNYILFVGDGERCGTKAEVLYRASTPTGERWVEIGTLILDDGRIRRNSDGSWSIEPGMAIVAGAALGAERLMAVMEGRASLTAITQLQPLFETVDAHIEVQPRSFFEGDIRVLVDQARACAFLVCEENLLHGSPQATLVQIMARRIRRKLATLGVQDSDRLLTELEAGVIAIYGQRHAQLQLLPGRLRHLVAQVPWPEGWNPESYQAVSHE